MNCKLRINKGFTLIELVVAVGLLAIVLSFAGVIFRVSINAHRTAIANAEIMQKMRAIIDQLNADFKGLRKDAPVAVGYDSTGGDPAAIRSDRIVFFSNGDFQSTRLYNNKIVAGNVARVYYGQSAEPNPRTNDPKDFKKVILARKLQILTADFTLPDTNIDDPNDLNEYTKRSLSEWKLVTPPQDEDAFSNWIGRPNVLIYFNDPIRKEEAVPMFMAKGVHDFRIQVMTEVIDGNLIWWPNNQQVISKESYNHNQYPPAFKFTFTLYDSNGIIKEGRTFTHIVYLDR
jgi:prepilin-type N-terminal cleavage/methylation domain-containing protein